MKLLAIKNGTLKKRIFLVLVGTGQKSLGPIGSGLEPKKVIDLIWLNLAPGNMPGYIQNRFKEKWSNPISEKVSDIILIRTRQNVDPTESESLFVNFLECDWLRYRTRQKVSTDRPASLRSFPCNTFLVCFPIFIFMLAFLFRWPLR